MIETWRWFGPTDPISLAHIAQTGASGIVTSLHHVPTGSIWPLDEIYARKKIIEDKGLTWVVAESVPVHNDIKAGTQGAGKIIENYRESIRNLGMAGIKTVCYNFMPVVDWTRTDLDFVLPQGTRALRFDMTAFAAYDIFILEREGASTSYSPVTLEKAKSAFLKMSPHEREKLERNIIAGLPGGEGSYDRAGIRRAIQTFNDLGDKGLRQNLSSFLREVVPVAEEVGVNLCIHPDDPPFSLFGLPRIVSTIDNIRDILNEIPRPANGLTLCAGSFGSREDNDLLAMAREFGPRIHFTHLRNVKREPDGSFCESDHLDGDNDMVGLIRILLEEEARRQQNGPIKTDIAMRPDHGHLLADEIGKDTMNPGYSYAGRLKGLAELRGVITAISHTGNPST